MRKIREKDIRECVRRLALKANVRLRDDVRRAIWAAAGREVSARGRRILRELLENAKIAQRDSLALCQDTGLPVVFVEIGPDVDASGVNVTEAVQQGVVRGYREGSLRNSIVADPLRRGKPGFGPCIVHTTFVRSKGFKVTLLPKGFGCENKTQLKMMPPTSDAKDIEDFIVGAVRDAGPDACPPYIVGVGIGGSSDYACQLAKEALLRPIDKRSRVPHVARMEKALIQRLNRLGIGPMGLGGKTTVLGVNILSYPTHIAGLPVCVNISCHVLRSASEIL
ncbi:MAG: fumarate hydratase [Candidatus Omnitrophica bacterium]|nr:fumarate hydratase [Candidatus Omnitrophota bacterium]MDD5538743.1 fumarate hydratase [Candidatus Omnitrophota bacterium]